MKFNYQARTKTGEIQSGTVEAPSKEAAVALLQKYKLFVTFIEKAAAQPIYAKKIKLFERISQKDLMTFSRQLAIMFKSKVSLVESLNTLASQTKNEAFQEKILRLSELVEGGTSFSEALGQYPKLFSPFYISMVKAGETAGTLSQSLEYLAEHLEREYHLRSRIKGAMIYPALIIFVAAVVLFLMMFFVVPELTKMLEETGQELPLITKAVIALSDFSRSWGWLFMIILIGLIIGLRHYSKSPSGKKIFDKNLLKLPLIGEFLKMMYLSRFAENLSTLIAGGIPIAESLEITGGIVGNDTYQKVILEARDEVRKGEQISTVIGRFPEIFPPVFTQMTLVGEKTGTLEQSLMNVVDFYQKEVDRSIANLLNIMEPVLIIFLGGVVGLIMASILMPLYRMATI